MSQQSRPFWLSGEALDGIRELVRGRASIQAIFEVCSAQPPSSSVMALAGKVAEELQLDSATVYEILFALWNLRRLHRSSNLPSAEFLAQISVFLARRPARSIDEETRLGWDVAVQTLTPILPALGDEHQLFISQKAQSLATEPPQEQLDEDAEWAQLEKMALSGEQLDELAEYFRSTGQASA
jgi:hypothetical protein